MSNGTVESFELQIRNYERFRSLLDRMSIDASRRKLEAETEDETWWYVGILEGWADDIHDFFNGVLGEDEKRDNTDERYKWVWKMWFTNMIAYIKLDLAKWKDRHRSSTPIGKCGGLSYPSESGSFTAGTPARKALDAGRLVLTDSNGWLVESWDPATKDLYNSKGEKIGTSQGAPKAPEKNELRITGTVTQSRDNRTPLTERARVLNGINDAWLDNFFFENPDMQVTFDATGQIIEYWDSKTKKVYGPERDPDGNLSPFTERDTPFGGQAIKKEVKNPVIGTYKPDQKDQFAEGSDAWEALNAGREVTLDSRGNIISIWDREKGIDYDIFGRELGTRTDPYPSDTNISELKDTLAGFDAQIAALRASKRGQPRAVRIAIQAKINAILKRRGPVLWQLGRVTARRKKMNENSDAKRTNTIRYISE